MVVVFFRRSYSKVRKKCCIQPRQVCSQGNKDSLLIDFIMQKKKTHAGTHPPPRHTSDDRGRKLQPRPNSYMYISIPQKDLFYQTMHPVLQTQTDKQGNSSNPTYSCCKTLMIIPSIGLKNICFNSGVV